MSRYDKYNLDLKLGRTEEKLRVDIDYQPSGVLELDTRPIAGEQLQSWRKQTVAAGPRHRCQSDYLAQRECAEHFGVTEGMWRIWEFNDVPTCWRPLVREFFVNGVTAESRELAPPEMVIALANLVGGMDVLAEELGTTHDAVRIWRYRDGAPKSGGCGALVRWLFDELDLEKQSEVRRAQHKAKLTASQVREIRRRAAADESIASIARDFPVSYPTIYSAAKGATYQWVK